MGVHIMKIHNMGGVHFTKVITTCAHMCFIRVVLSSTTCSRWDGESCVCVLLFLHCKLAVKLSSKSNRHQNTNTLIGKLCVHQRVNDAVCLNEVAIGISSFAPYCIVTPSIMLHKGEHRDQ